jgi:hypothetical protein
MGETRFYNSRIQMAFLFIFSIGLAVLAGWIVYFSFTAVLYWPRLIIGSFFFLLFVWFTIDTAKETIRPTLLVMLTDTEVIIEFKKKATVIRWEDIESYMIFRSSGGSTSFYLFLKEGISTELPKHVKIDYSFMKNKHELKSIFDKKNIKELKADPELIKTIR